MKITVDAAEAAALLAKAAGSLAGGNALAVAGRTLENAVLKFYRGKGGVFWPRLGKAWQPETGTRSVAVVMDGAWGAILSHKITGGKVVARAAKNLAIPANAEARKKGSPRNFKGDFLRFVRFGPNGPKALVKAEKKGAKGKRAKPGQAKPRKRPEVWYWLKESVVQKADPGALPPAGDLARTVEAGVRDYLKRSGWGP